MIRILPVGLTAHIHYRLKNQLHKQTISLEQTGVEAQFPGLQIELVKTDIVNGYRLQVLAKASNRIQLKQCSLQFSFQAEKDDRVLANGYQSWTETRSFDRTEKLVPIKKGAKPLFGAFGDYDKHSYAQKEGVIHGWTYLLVHSESATEQLLMASLAEETGFTLLEVDLPNGELKAEKELKTLFINGEYVLMDLILSVDRQAALFEQYFDLLGLPDVNQRNNGLKNLSEGVAGWTSWYYYYTNISEYIILENLQAFHKRNIPIQIFQIDDGWQNAVGDWLISNRKFPHGMAWLSEQIHQRGYQAGLWLAPLICQKQSVLFRQHPDWLLKDAQGNLVKASYNALWKSWMYVLDFYHPEVQTYLRKVFQQVFEVWGFDMVKLDFLYAVGVYPGTDRTAGRIVFDMMAFFREIAGDKIILACGVPLAAAFGQVDFCRIGPDVHLAWEMGLLKWLGSRERVSTIMALENAIHRHQINGKAFFNDPDVSILRSRKNQLNFEQRYTLFFINQLFGSLQFISDNINEYEDETLLLYQSQFPLRAKEILRIEQVETLYYFRFKMGDLLYQAWSNFSDKKEPIVLDASAEQYFHNRTNRWCAAGEILTVAPWETICLLEVANKQTCQIAGSTGHLFPGSEWRLLEGESHGHVKLETHQHLLHPSKVYLFLPTEKRITINGQQFDVPQSRMLEYDSRALAPKA